MRGFCGSKGCGFLKDSIRVGLGFRGVRALSEFSLRHFRIYTASFYASSSRVVSGFLQDLESLEGSEFKVYGF